MTIQITNRELFDIIKNLPQIQIAAAALGWKEVAVSYSSHDGKAPDGVEIWGANKPTSQDA